MEKFLNNLMHQAEENPIAALAVAAAVFTGLSKFIDASGHAVGSRAYAKQVNHRIRKSSR